MEFYLRFPICVYDAHTDSYLVGLNLCLRRSFVVRTLFWCFLCICHPSCVVHLDSKRSVQTAKLFSFSDHDKRSYVTGVHSTEKGLQTDVRHEVHEQEPVCGERGAEKRAARGGDSYHTGSPLSSQPLVLLPR